MLSSFPAWSQEQAPAPTVMPPSLPTNLGYVIVPDDLINMSVFGEMDLSTQAHVSKNGYITFPLIGSIHVAGNTVDQITHEITQLYAKDYLVNPQVTIVVQEYAVQRVTILGQVQRPGTVDIPSNGQFDVLAAIAMAGGYTRIANPSRISVRRNVNGVDVILQVNGNHLAQDKNQKPFYIQPGDTITVSESMF